MEYQLLNTKIPTLKCESSFSRYRNPLNEQREQNSFEVMQSEYPIQLIAYPSFQIDGINYRDLVDQQIKEQGLIKEQDYKLNQTTFGCKKLCQIDCLLVERYFNQLQEVFRTSNQQYTLESEKLSNEDWLRDRMQHRYRSRIYAVFDEMINVKEVNNLKQNGLKHLEKHVNKPRIPFINFLNNIHQLIHEMTHFQN